MNLIVRKNQQSQLKQLFTLGSGILLKSYSLKGILGLVEYNPKRVDISKVFDSMMHILKEFRNVKIVNLNNMRGNLFDNRKSRSSKYTIDKLTKNIKESFGSCITNNHPSLPIFESFMKIIIRYFGESNFIENYIIFDKINEVVRDN